MKESHSSKYYSPGCVESELVEIVLEHPEHQSIIFIIMIITSSSSSPVHQGAVLSLPQGLVNKQLGLLGDVELDVLARQRRRGVLQAVKVSRPLQDLHVQRSPDCD